MTDFFFDNSNSQNDVDLLQDVNTTSLVNEIGKHKLIDTNVLTAVEEIFKNMKESAKMTDDIAMRLNFFFEQTFIASLELLDKELITKVIANPSGRFCFRVESQTRSESSYVCFLHYCPCRSFNFSVLLKNEALMCKHQLAAKIADALGEFHTQYVSDTEFGSLLLQEDNKV